MIRRLISLVLVCLLAVVVLVPARVSAQDQPSGDLNPIVQDIAGGGLTPGMTYKLFSGFDFEPNTSNLGYSYTASGRYATVLDSTAGFSLRLDLPQGAQVYEIMFLYRDNSTLSLNFFVSTYTPSTRRYSDPYSANTDGVQATNIMGYTFFNPSGAALFSIDNVNTEYRLRVRMSEASSNQIIYGARVGYKPATTGFISDLYKTYSAHSFNSPNSRLHFYKQRHRGIRDPAGRHQSGSAPRSTCPMEPGSYPFASSW